VESVEVGKIASEEADLISRALQLSGLTASSAMVPRSQVDAVAAAADIATIEAVAAPNRRSRLVVYGRDLDDPLGVVHLRDILALEPDERDGRRADEFVYSLVPVAADTPLEDVLLQMQRERRHVAAVVESGQLCGIVTMQDVLRTLITRRPPAEHQFI